MIRIRAKVRRIPTHARDPRLRLTQGNPWVAYGYVEGDRSRFRCDWYPTVTEAITAAIQIRTELDAELMDEVHASRASRRQATRDIHTLEATA